MVPAEKSEVVSAFRSEGRWAPHTTRSWQFLGFEEGVTNPPDGREWLPSLDKSSEDIIVGILDSGERSTALHSRIAFVVSIMCLICFLACTLAAPQGFGRSRGASATKGSGRCRRGGKGRAKAEIPSAPRRVTGQQSRTRVLTTLIFFFSPDEYIES